MRGYCLCRHCTGRCDVTLVTNGRQVHCSQRPLKKISHISPPKERASLALSNWICTSGRQETCPQSLQTKCGCSPSLCLVVLRYSKRQTRSPRSSLVSRPASVRSVRFRKTVA